MKSATLAEFRATTEALAEAIGKHADDAHDGDKCKPECPELKQMRAVLKARQEAIRGWFDPPADAEGLF